MRWFIHPHKNKVIQHTKATWKKWTWIHVDCKVRPGTRHLRPATQ